MHSYHREAIRPPCKCHQKFGFAPIKKDSRSRRAAPLKTETNDDKSKNVQKAKSPPLTKSWGVIYVDPNLKKIP